MKKYIIGLLMCVSTFSVFAQSKKVLFIGNSLTYYNEMPNTFESIANSLGYETEVEIYAPGGVGMAYHAQSEELFTILRKEQFDFVIMQPGTSESAVPLSGGVGLDTTLQNIQIILDTIYAYSPCAQVMFYEISNGVKGITQEDMTSYNMVMDTICSNLKTFSDSTGLSMVPVGEAFKISWNNDNNFMLWSDFYNVHPNAKGSYLAVCVFYASIFQKSSVGAFVVPEVSADEAHYFQTLADFVVLEHLPEWQLEMIHTSDFLMNSDGFEFDFTNQSLNYDSLRWNFGDGTYSYEENPTHNYLIDGTYNIVLDTWKDACLISSQQTTEIQTGVVLIENDEKGICLYPNPCRNILFVEGVDSELTYFVYTVTGRLILTSKEKKLDVSALKTGVYYIKYSDKSYRFVKD